MKVKHLLESPYRRGFPDLNGTIQDHEMFVKLIEEHRQKMVDTSDDEVPHRLPVFRNKKDAAKACNIEMGYSEETVPEPIAWVMGFNIDKLGFKYNLSICVEYDKDVLGENFFNNVRFGYYNLIGITEHPHIGGVSFGKPTKLIGFHLDELSDKISLTGQRP